MSAPRIDAWLSTIGRTTAAVAPTGMGATAITMTGEHTTFQAAAAELQARLNAAAIGIVFAVTAQTDGVLIHGDAAFDWSWWDDEQQAYFGFATGTYINVTDISSDGYATGRISLIHGADFSFRDILLRRSSQDHRGAIAAILLRIYGAQRMTLLIDPTEAEHFAVLLARLLQGVPASVSIDAANANTFAWTAAAWEGIRSLALQDTGAKHSLTQWLGTGTAIYRRIALDFVEAS